MIYYLPLEALDARYTKDLDLQLANELKRQKKQFVRVGGDSLTDKVEKGAFLDANSTNYFKFIQLQKVCQLFYMGKVKDGDIFFVSDLWFPGLEAIPYMAYFNRVKVKIMGLLHAGSFTPTDFVANMSPWASWIETGWFSFVDKIFVGSNQIKNDLIGSGRIINFGQLYRTGLPFDLTYCYKHSPFIPWEKRENVVVFAGRLDDEKQPWIFDHLASEFTDVKFVKTFELKLTKAQYYKLLSYSKVMFSSALQENFGYACLEACAYGLNLVVPDRLAYKDLYPLECRYSDFNGAKRLLEHFLVQDNSQAMVSIAEAQKSNVRTIVGELC